MKKISVNFKIPKFLFFFLLFVFSFLSGALLVYALGLNSSGIYVFESGKPIKASEFNHNFKIVAPSGLVAAFYRKSSDGCPDGWALADGGNHMIGGTSIKVPDLRGRYVRGADLASGNDPDNSTRVELAGGIDTKIGSFQLDEIKQHNHKVHGTNHTNTPSSTDYSSYEYGRFLNNYASTALTGGKESRPKNIALIYCIKK